MTPTPTAQLLLPLSGEDKARPAPLKPRKPKPHHRPRSDGPLLPLTQPRYLPVVGVPKTRGECPTERPCPHLRCRWNLFLETGEHRAGRPGLANVPRNERGLTVSVLGDMGGERAGTTANARWLELERRCSVWVERDERGKFVTLHAVYENEWNHFRERLHMGEAIDVLVDGARVGGARMTTDGLALDHEPQWFMATLQRVRGVSSCALDLIDKHGPMTNQEIGDAIGRHRTLVAREVRGALMKAGRNAEETGVPATDLAKALMSMDADD